MKTFLAQFLILVFTSAVALPSLADDTAKRPEEFKPYKLVGDWKFVNSSTGTKYGGDIEISLNDIDAKGVMHGRISYDGRQLNDVCSTVGLLTDKPVETEVIKSGNAYKVAFSVNCARGASPRVFVWALECSADGFCSQPNDSARGKGVTTLTEKR